MRLLILISLLFVSAGLNAIQYQCFVDEDCLQDEYCDNRQCVKFCVPEKPGVQTFSADCFSDGDCPMNEICENGICMAGSNC